MLLLLKRTFLMRWFFWAPKTYSKIDDEYETIYNLQQEIFVYMYLNVSKRPKTFTHPTHMFDRKNDNTSICFDKMIIRNKTPGP